MPRRPAPAEAPRPEEAPPVAYSLLRFSTPEQSRGDSRRRQTARAADWCARQQVPLDKSLWAFDPAVSGFTGAHRANPDRHALAAFLLWVEKGRVRPGSYLLAEALDRLTREDIQPALLLILGLLQQGVRIVQLLPTEVVYDRRSGPHEIMLMIVELMRGHSESKAKSERLGDAWAEKRAALRRGEGQPVRREDRVNGLRVLTRRLPAWVELRAGVPALVPDRAAAVARIFELSAAGYGTAAIVDRIAADGVPPLGRSGRWTRAYVQLILADRRALGEFQPRTRGGAADGPPVPGYFPAVVTEATWRASRRGAADRRIRRGRTGAQVNLFAGLLRHARDGSAFVLNRRPGAPRHSLLVNLRDTSGRGRHYGFPYDVFEAAVLSRLAEIDPRAVLGAAEGGPDEALLLSDELHAVEASVAAIVADLDVNGDSPALFRRLREKEAAQRALAVKLAAARRQAAHPLAESWGETRSLLAALAAAPDPREARLRLRSALRQVTAELRLLVVPVSRVRRFAVVQFDFHGGARRTYLIDYRAAGNRRPRRCESRALADATTVAADLDLRRPEDVRELERELLALAATRALPALSDPGTALSM